MRTITALLLLAAASAACAPALPGPQLLRAPPGLGYVPPQGEPRGATMGRAVVSERVWMAYSEPAAVLTVAQVAGRLTRAEVETYIADHPRAFPRTPVLHDERIDSRPGLIMIDRGDGSIRGWAVVPYDDASFVIAFSSRRAEHQDDAALRRALASFRRDPGSATRVLVPVGAVLAVALAAYALRKFRSPPPPPRVISRPRRTERPVPPPEA